MIINLCPACRHVNAADALRCEACGLALAEGATQRLPLHRFTERRHPGALWLDDLVAPAPAPAPHAQDEPGAPALSLTLRDIQPPPLPAIARAAAPPPAEHLVVSDPEVPEQARDAWVRCADDAPLGDAATQTARKTARRAAVRHARLRGAMAADGAAPAPPKMLVLDTDGGARTQLCGLLRSFGFDVYPVPDAARAATLVASRAFAAVFVDVALDAADGGVGIDLCRQVRQESQRRPGAATLLVLVAAQLTPMDRVRAELAGCAEAILKPVTRGSVARVLDTHGIALPADARQR